MEIGQKYVVELHNILLEWEWSDSWVGTQNTDVQTGFHGKSHQISLVLLHIPAKLTEAFSLITVIAFTLGESVPTHSFRNRKEEQDFKKSEENSTNVIF